MSDRMLLERWDLELRGETIEDVEAVCRGAIYSQRWTWALEPADEAELLAHLLGEVVVLTERYRPPTYGGVSRRPDEPGGAARAWLFQRLVWASIDWHRAFYGRNGQHRPLADLDAAADRDDDHRGAGHDPDKLRSGGSYGAPGEAPGDSGDDGPDGLRRLLEDGDRRLLREIEALGLGPPPGARGRTPRARRELARLERQRRRRLAEQRERVAA